MGRGGGGGDKDGKSIAEESRGLRMTFAPF